MAEPRLTAREWDALGSLLLPPELGGKSMLGPKTTAKLAALGYIEPFEELIHGTGKAAINRFPIRVRGWRMTLMGNTAYCSWAASRMMKEKHDV